jgi:hypothetical protein
MVRRVLFVSCVLLLALNAVGYADTAFGPTSVPDKYNSMTSLKGSRGNSGDRESAHTG